MSIIFLRTILLYFLMSLAVRLMGKRQVGELQPVELVVTIIISNIASLPLEEPSLPLFVSVIPVLTLVAMEVVLSAVSLKSRRIRRWFSGSPVVVIYEGVILQKPLRALRFSVEDLMEELRIAGVFDITDVQTAIVETSGKLSVQKRSTADSLTPQSLCELQIVTKDKETVRRVEIRDGGQTLRQTKSGAILAKPGNPPPFLVVSDGEICMENLPFCEANELQIREIIANEGLQLSDVLLLTLDTRQRYHLVCKGGER